MARVDPLAAGCAGFLADRGLGPGTPVVVAVSGGCDSVVLLDLLARHGLLVNVAHLDHRLRGEESAADAAFVAAMAGVRGFPCLAESADVAAVAAATGESLESAARRLRRAFFARAARAFGTSLLALGHTADDQAETVLWNLCRGSGLDGAAAMAADSWQEIDGSRVRLLRPLLAFRRSAVQAHARAAGLAWREDASNRSDAFTRNRIRSLALPALARACGRDPVAALARFAETARREGGFMAEAAAAVWPLVRGAGGEILLGPFRAQAPAIRQRLLAMWLAESGLPVASVELAALDRIALAAGRPARRQLPRGWSVRRRAGCLLLEAPAPD
jgi:tRNA(Ile)-lysidine synthase